LSNKFSLFRFLSLRQMFEYSAAFWFHSFVVGGIWEVREKLFWKKIPKNAVIMEKNPHFCCQTQLSWKKIRKFHYQKFFSLQATKGSTGQLPVIYFWERPAGQVEF
jgi:hypothetical protein